MSRAFVFPGQGSQAVGMGTSLAGAFATAREVFQEVDEALKQNLSRLMAEGPEADLALTENAQPALMAVSMAMVRVLEKDGGKPLATVEDLNARYTEAIDEDRLEAWPDFFSADGRYLITTAENVAQGLPLGIMSATSRAIDRARSRQSRAAPGSPRRRWARPTWLRVSASARRS